MSYENLEFRVPKKPLAALANEAAVRIVMRWMAERRGKSAIIHTITQ